MSGVEITMDMMLYTGDLSAATAGLIRTLFELVVLIVLLRFLLPLARVNYFNPVSQFVIRITDPILRPLRRLIPSVGRIDSAALVMVIVLQLAQVFLVASLAGATLPLTVILVYTLRTLIQMVLFIFFVAIIASAILSWFAHSIRHPIVEFLQDLTHPVLAPFRRVIPPISGIDISPLLAILALQFLIALLT